MKKSKTDDVERKLPEEEGAAGEAKWRRLFETMSDGVFYQRADGSLIDVNEAALGMFGLSRDEFLSRTSMHAEWKVVSEDGTPLAGPEHPSMLALRTGKPVQNLVVGVVDPRTTTYTWLAVSALPEFHDGASEPFQVVVTMHDITERKRAEAALEEREEYYRMLFESSMDAIFVADAETGQLLDANRQAEWLMGYSRAELLRLNQADLHPDAERYRKVFREHVHEGTVSPALRDSEVRHRDGSVIPVEINAVMTNLGGRHVAVASFHDVRARITNEQELRQSRERLAIATQAGGIGVWDRDIVNDVLVWDDRMYELYGVEPERFGGAYEAWTQGVHPDDVGRAVREVEQAERGEKPFDTEFRIVRPDGQVRHIRASAHIIRDESGAAVRMIGVNYDITARKQADEQVRQNEERFRTLATLAPVGIYITDSDGNCQYANPTWCEMSGLQMEEALGMGWAKGLHPDDREQVFSDWNRMVAAAGKWGQEYRFQTPAGKVTWVYGVAAPQRDASGKITHYVGVNLDITGRRQSEEALRESEAQVRRKLESILSPTEELGELELSDLIDVPGIQHLMDGFYALTRVPNAIVDLEGKVLVGTGWQDICTKFHRVHPETLKNCIECDTVLSKGVQPGTFKTYLCKNSLWDCVTPLMIGGKHMGNLFTGQFFFEGEKPDDSVFRAQASKYGFDEDAYMAAVGRVPTWDRETISVAFEFYATLANMITSLSHSNLALAKSLEARKQAETVLRESEARYRVLLDRANDGIAVVAFDGKLTSVNLSFAEMHGYTVDEMEHMSLAELDTPETGALVSERMASLRTGEPLTFEVQHYHKDGRVLLIEVSANQVSIGGEHYILCVHRDIGERKQAQAEKERLQAQLAQAQKMESVGRLAGGVAHDFNNLLMGILNYVELGRDKLPPEHTVRGYLDEISSDAQRSAEITRQLLAFARKQTISPKVLDLNDTVTGTLKMLGRLLGENISLTWGPGADLWPVKIDPSQVAQVLVNLGVNARDAIAGPGQLTIRTANVKVDCALANGHAGAIPGDYVLLTVSDSGCGMSQDVLEHVFEPFFTTKEVGKGTGLGLATVYGIVEQNKGFVAVDSEPGEGTTFSIHLPRCLAESAKATQEAPAECPRGNETVLLVEDEKSVRVTTALFLEELGYTVLVADSPEEALGLAAQHAGEIALLITDVIMPGMSGNDMAGRLLEARPVIKRLFISGFTADIIEQDGILDGSVPFLSKPFGRMDLARKVREILDKEEQMGQAHV